MNKSKIFIIFITVLLVGYQNCSQIKLDQKIEASNTKIFALKVKLCDFEDYSTKIFYGYNRNSVALDGYYYADSDGDGLTDLFEEDPNNKDRYGLSSFVRDSNLDGFDDLIVVRFDKDIDAQNQFPVCPDLFLDADRDGVNDCTEDLMGLDKYRPDSDSDGIPDRLEIANSLNALDARDASADIDGDGVSNVDEVRIGTPVQLSNVELPTLKQVQSSMEVLIGEGCRVLSFEGLPFYEGLTSNQFVVEILEQNNSGQVILRKANYYIDREDFFQREHLIDMDESLIFEGRSEGTL